MRGASARASVLLTPLGGHSLLEAFRLRLPALQANPLTVAPMFASGADYDDAVRASCDQVGAVIPVDGIEEILSTCAADDWVLLADPLCFPLEPVHEAPLVERLPHSRAATHLVTMSRNPGGTTDRVRIDRRGGVRGIQRYYDARTTFVSGVVCTLLPASTFGDVANELMGCHSLAEFRFALARLGVPSRDLPIGVATLDLRHAVNLLRVTEQATLESTAAERTTRHALIDRSARLCGPVSLHEDVVISRDAIVIGPTMLAAGCRIGAGAVVAQCLIGPGVVVPDHAVVRHRAIFSDSGFMDSLQSLEPEYDEGLAVGMLSEHASEARPPIYPIVKNVLDRLIAVIATILLSPLLAAVAILIKLDSRGSVLYGDLRETIGGRLFTCWKFRTMHPGAASQQGSLAGRNQMDGPQFKIDGDPRITRLGRRLRRVSLDELPQLFNVIVGDMSLVGPRPSPFRENQICVPWRQARLSVRAGITGLWQVCRDERTKGDFHQWIEYDSMYVRHMSWAVDLRIILATIWTFGGAGRVPYERIIPNARIAAKALAPLQDATQVRAAV
jgi:lipopolysaccharide/colanic/teichoic acid biosynthesis glycosyltransferase